MRRITGAAALGYVALAAIENMGLLGAPRLGAPAGAVEGAYADTALAVVTTAAGALSLISYVLFAVLITRASPAAPMTGASPPPVARRGPVARPWLPAAVASPRAASPYRSR